MNIENLTFDSVEKLVKFITELDKVFLAKKEQSENQGIIFDSQPIILFRGEEDISFKLKPSVFRTDKLKKNENRLFNKLFSAHADEFDKDKNTFDKLVRMQHYGLPTRLLDITKNPLVALYFACQPAFVTDKLGNILHKFLILRHDKFGEKLGFSRECCEQ